MKTFSKLGMFTAASLIAAAQLTMPAFAAEADATPAAASSDAAKVTAAPANTEQANTEQTSKAKTNTEKQQLLLSSDEAYQALRDVQAARLAIFNGKPDIADKQITAASEKFKTAATHAEGLSIDTAKAKSNDDSYIPVDISMSLAEGFVATEAKAEKIKQANEHIAKGDEKKAAEVLKLAEIDITVVAALLPIDASVRHVNAAIDLMAKKQYYEANLALKAIEDSMLIESFGIDSVPAQGKQG